MTDNPIWRGQIKPLCAVVVSGDELIDLRKAAAQSLAEWSRTEGQRILDKCLLDAMTGQPPRVRHG
jgi:hypothetical protein